MLSGMVGPGHCGRTASYLTAPAQIPACGFLAPGSSGSLASAIRPKRGPTITGTKTYAKCSGAKTSIVLPENSAVSCPHSGSYANGIKLTSKLLLYQLVTPCLPGFDHQGKA